MKKSVVFAVIALLLVMVGFVPASAAEEQGTVKWFDAEKGYGFITRAAYVEVAPYEPFRLTLESEEAIAVLAIHLDGQSLGVRQIDDGSWSAEFPNGLSEGEHEVGVDVTWADGTREFQAYRVAATYLPETFRPEDFAPTAP